jgi:N4-bis(aminopropyl)spermidine synthase
MDARAVVGEVAAVVGLAEGEEGVRDVIRVVARLQPVAVRRISRATELPVPFVSAICNELRKRGVVSPLRPVQLTPAGRKTFGERARTPGLATACSACDGRAVVLPPALASSAHTVAALARKAPEPRVELDQVHCTVETKLRRVLAMDEAGALDGRRVLLLGDDDLTSVALAFLAAEHGIGASVRELIVVDVDARLVAFLARALRDAPFPVECVAHDLREPLPGRLHGRADTVFTDPPYTGRGAALFLSRAAEATAGRAGRHVFFAFGPKRPDETLELQRAIVGMGFSVQRLVRNFNDYVGAGALGGTSHLYQLATTTELRPLVDGRHEGPLYTGDFREPSRDYRCTACGRTQRVGRGLTWTTVEALKRDGCLRCGGRLFAPLTRGRTSAPAGRGSER